MKLGRLNHILPGTGRGTVEDGGGGWPTGAVFGASPLRHRFAAPPPRAGEELEK